MQTAAELEQQIQITTTAKAIGNTFNREGNGVYDIEVVIIEDELKNLTHFTRQHCATANPAVDNGGGFTDNEIQVTYYGCVLKIDISEIVETLHLTADNYTEFYYSRRPIGITIKWRDKIDALKNATKNELELSAADFLNLANDLNASGKLNSNLTCLHTLHNYYMEMSALSIYQSKERQAVMTKYNNSPGYFGR